MEQNEKRISMAPSVASDKSGAITASEAIKARLKATTKCTGFLKIHDEYICPKGSTCVAYTDDLQTLAAGQENGTIQLFQNGEIGLLLSDYDTELEEQPVVDIKIKSSPKGGYNKSILACYLAGHIKLWDTVLGKTLFTMRENRQIFSVDYHPRSHRFATSGNDFKVYLYDEEIRVLERILACSEIFGSTNGHQDYVSSSKFHPKNPFELISAGLDGTIQFWDIRAPFASRNISGVAPFGDGLDISDDGNTILACDSGKPYNILKVFDYSTGKLLKEYHHAGSFPFCCKFLTPMYAGIGTFYQHSFRVVNLTTSRIVASVTNLPGCVMNFALHREVPRHRSNHNSIPRIALSAAEKVVELDPISHMIEPGEKGNYGRGDENLIEG